MNSKLGMKVILLRMRKNSLQILKFGRYHKPHKIQKNQMIF